MACCGDNCVGCPDACPGVDKGTVIGANCSSGCVTRDHATWGDCIRGKSTRVLYSNSANGLDATAEKRLSKDLEAYRNARAQGIQPATTQRHHVDAAVAVSEHTGTPFQANA